ncbi:hypothetical protein [Nitrospirillum sp. BR 11163]|uniref:hypothetical protein n=1 Tax=Nitrospirillum sp. BR 11163 TaxID=3104323 RepID=UPI002AFE7869|nr:hypothetical protein [Nitrospirillum sp. BR 11163]MEA1674112.1 hypothetical protein [Nitrospirillum sp. BR 11163]
MSVFNGRTYTAAMFSGADGYQYAALWDQFFSDVLIEIGNSSPSLVMQSVNALVAIVQGYAAQALASAQAAVAVSGLSNLGAYAGKVADGAILCMFVYDRSRDRDGGAWAKTCTWQSWVSEVASGTRGARRDFPNLSLIVVYTSGTLVIYDCDQAAPAMWMVFTLGLSLRGYGAVNRVIMRDGILYRTSNTGTDGDLYVWDFVADACWYAHVGGTFRPDRYRVIDRNTGAGGSTVIGPAIGSSQCTDLAITVQPGAALDATGRAKHSVIVAHTNGFSAIHPAGTVNIAATGGYVGIAVLEGERIAAILASNSNVIDIGPVPYASASRAAWFQYLYGSGTSGSAGAMSRPDSSGMTGVIPGAVRNAAGVWRFIEDAVNPAAGLQAMITAGGNAYAGGGAFNTGWMPGDCRLALSTTATGSITASGELVTNGTFTSTAGWTAYQGATLAASSNTLTITNTTATNGLAYQTIATVAGQTYLVTVDAVGGTSTVAVVSAGSSINNNDLGQVLTGTTTGAIRLQFTAKGATTYINLVADNGSGHTIGYKNCSVQLAEPDRSTKAVALQVKGILTRQLVATSPQNAELAAWSGFSVSNYLTRPWTSADEYGAGATSGVIWVCPSVIGNTQVWISRDSTAQSARVVVGANTAGQPYVVLSDGTLTFSASSSRALLANVWAQLAWVRRANNTLELWQDGVRVAVANISGLGSINNASASLYIGVTAQGTSPASGALTLPRMSATEISPEQIAIMYRDERQMMQGGAKVTLGGALSSVQAMAWDPDTRQYYFSKGDGTAVFSGLVRAAYQAALAGSTSDNHQQVAAAAGAFAVGTSAQVVASLPALVLRDAILDNRDKVRPVDPNHIVFPEAPTNDNTPTILARIPVSEYDQGQVTFDVVAVEDSAAPTETAGYQIRVRYSRLPNGSVTVANVQHIATDVENTTTMDVTGVADGLNNICLQGIGVTGKRIRWGCAATTTRAGYTRYA